MKNSLRIHKWTHNEFNIFILGVLTHPLSLWLVRNLERRPNALQGAAPAKHTEHIKTFYKRSSENRFFQPSRLLAGNNAITRCFDKQLIIKHYGFCVF